MTTQYNVELLPKRQLPRGVEQVSERVAYARSKDLPNATVLPEGADNPEDGRSAGFDANAPFAAFRDGKPINKQAELVQQAGAVVQMGQDVAVSTGHSGPTAVQGVVPKAINSIPNTPTVAVPQETEAEESGKKSRKRRSRGKAQDLPSPASLPTEPVTFAGAFGQMVLQCTRVIIDKEFIVLVQAIGANAMQWVPPVSAEKEDGSLENLALTFRGVQYSVYFLGIHFVDPAAGYDYTIFNL